VSSRNGIFYGLECSLPFQAKKNMRSKERLYSKKKDKNKIEKSPPKSDAIPAFWGAVLCHPKEIKIAEGEPYKKTKPFYSTFHAS
tara:strand:- start:537 stop:791 length:255 start_codon:yes stop_codon:yes gene_type:complete